MIMHYVANAPLARLTEGYVRSCQDIRGFSDEVSEALMQQKDDEADRVVKKLEEQLAGVIDDLGLLRTMVADDVEDIRGRANAIAGGQYTFARRAAKLDRARWHKLPPTGNQSGKAPCGFKFMHVACHFASTEPPIERRCGRCFGKQPGAGEHESSSSS